MNAAGRPRSRGRLVAYGLLAVAVLGLLLVGGAAVVVFGIAFSDTTRTLDDFATQEEARAFVSAHLPVQLPEAAQVRNLRYERFMDWHLEARATVPAPGEANAYLNRLQQARTTNDDYCGPVGPGDYFLPDSHACCSIERHSSTITLRCFTR